MILCYNVHEIWYMIDEIFIVHFGLFFALLHPCEPEKLKLNNNEQKKHLDISSFYTYVPKITIT